MERRRENLDHIGEQHNLVARVAVLESEVRALQNGQSEVLKEVRAMRDDMNRYRGFIGGVVFLGGAVWAFFAYAAKRWIFGEKE